MKGTFTRGRGHVRVEGEDRYKKINEEKKMLHARGRSLRNYSPWAIHTRARDCCTEATLARADKKQEAVEEN